MRTFQIVLFSLCIIGLVAVLGIIVGAPKLANPAQRTAAMRPEILQSLQRAVHLADSQDGNEAMKMVDAADGFSNKTNLEVMEINQVRGFVMDRQEHRESERASGVPLKPRT